MKSSQLSQAIKVFTENKIEANRINGVTTDFTFGDENQYKISIASDRKTKNQAYQLLYQTYLEKGFAKERSSKLWISIYDAHPETVTMVVKKEEEVVGALTVVYDSCLGLPCQKIYESELDNLRKDLKYPAEIISLGIKKDIRGSAEILVKLFNFSYIFSKKIRGATSFVITVNPRHSLFYQKKLLFQIFGNEKDYQKVSDAPAILLELDLDIPKNEIIEFNSNTTVKVQNTRSMYKTFLSAEKENMILKELEEQFIPMTTADINYFFCKQDNIFEKASAEDLDNLKKCFYTKQPPKEINCVSI